MELPFAGLHGLCAPFIGQLGRLPAPQREALSTAFGLSEGPPPDRFLVGLAVLTLLADVADEHPLLCIVDDAQWLDRVSAQTLAFAARRLLAERVGLVFGLRATDEEPTLAGLPELELQGLGAADAGALLDATIPGPLDGQVRRRILAEAAGNPLALLELPRGLTSVSVAGGYGLPGTMTLTSRMEQGFAQRIASLPEETRRLLALAAAEPLGDAVLLHRSAQRLHIGDEAAAAAEAVDLIEIGAGVWFRHPLVRSAAYRAATAPERREIHRALAAATDPRLDPDRRAWHRAHAAEGPDEAVAAELERSAGRARARGGVAAAAAFLARAATLTPDPARRGERALAAADALLQAGAFAAARTLLSTAQTEPLDAGAQARVDRLLARIAFASDRGNAAAGLLLAAARRLEPIDPELARDTYLEAYSAAMFAGRLSAGTSTTEVAHAARHVLAPEATARTGEMILRGLTDRFTLGLTAAAPTGHRVLAAFRSDDLSVEDGLRWLWLACAAAADLWDDASWASLAARHVRMARDAGALSELALALTSRAQVHVFAGELDAAEVLIAESESVRRVTGTDLAPYAALSVAAWRGDARHAGALIEATLSDVSARGEGIGLTITQWANALLLNGLGRYEEAADSAQRCVEDLRELAAPNWGLSELVEAAARSGSLDVARAAHAQLVELTAASGTDWALGIETRARALLSSGHDADRLYREAVERLGRTMLRGEQARARLLHGEWLRREGRRVDARHELRSAFEALSAIGADAFANRARRELEATGETVRRRTPETRDALTPQETQIARLAADGHTNPEIGAQLFISPRTVEYHLRKVFGKLDISSRRELSGALS
jgi:DNA-binding CsgD family transcriptional regulator